MQSEMEFPEEHGCSSACRERIRAKNREQAKRDRDLLVQRQRREMRKKERVRGVESLLPVFAFRFTVDPPWS